MPLATDVAIDQDPAKSTVRATGEESHLITDLERKTFGIQDEDLKKAVEVYFGKKPNDAYLHGPTPWGDLYKKYGWEEVYVHVRPVEAKILDMSTKPLILKTETFNNDSSKTATFDVSIG
jgi:hypothetical protein